MGWASTNSSEIIAILRHSPRNASGGSVGPNPLRQPAVRAQKTRERMSRQRRNSTGPSLPSNRLDFECANRENDHRGAFGSAPRRVFPPWADEELRSVNTLGNYASDELILLNTVFSPPAT